MALEIGGKKVNTSGKPDYGNLLGLGEAAQLVSSKTGKGTVTIEKKKSSQVQAETTENHEVSMKENPKETLVSPTHLATVTVSAGQTINLGNYESAKVQISLAMPTHVHDIDAAFDYASDWVSEKMTETVTAMKG